MFVSMVKEYKKDAMTLAIGDGANDVSMITEAHIGVGIQGVEGREASKASDYSIGEFKILKRLLFYHGVEAYRKNSYLILFCFYKNIMSTIPLFFFGFLSGFTAQPIYSQILQQGYNMIFTSIPIILYVLFDELYATDEKTLKIFKDRPNELDNNP